MREIKFRAWDKKYKTFAYNESPDVFIGTDGKVYEKEERTYYMVTHTEYEISDCYELSQYTGLKDKNGTEIYEGDIVAGESFTTAMLRLWKAEGVEPESEIYTIKYDKASFKLFDNKDRWVAVLDHHIMSKPELLTVIGNIYEDIKLVGENNG